MCYLRHSGRMQQSPQDGIETGWKGPDCGGSGPSPPPPPASRTRCATNVATAADCFAQARALRGLENATFTTKAVENNAVPAGCSVMSAMHASASGTAIAATAVFNSNNESSACCGISSTSEVSGIVAALQGKVSMKLRISGGGGGGGGRGEGEEEGDGANSSSLVTVTLSGPATTWFGVGFNAMLMSDNPYAIIADGHGGIMERKLADQAPGIQLPKSVDVVSNVVVNGVRTVILTRSVTKSPPSTSFWVNLVGHLWGAPPP